MVKEINKDIKDLISHIQDYNFAVIGLGETGISIINYLIYKNAKLLKIFDTRKNPPHQEMVKNLSAFQLHFGNLNYKLFDDIDIIVISPGISIFEPVIQKALHNGKLVIGDIELFALETKNWKSKKIGITGSNGKTTVTTLIGYIARALGVNTLVAGNIGEPVLDSYLKIIQNKEQQPSLIVLELSSFQLESTYSLMLDSATVLNISEDHLDRYRDLLEYAYAKSNIFNNCKSQVLNANDVFTLAMKRSKQEQIYFGIENCEFCLKMVDKETYLQIGSKPFLKVKDLQLMGQHNYLNCLASLALLQAAGIKVEDNKVKAALSNFKGIEHRMQKVLEHNEIIFIEDSKGTNVGAVVAGVSGLDMPIHLILGGDGKGQDFAPLRDLVLKKCKSVAIIGQDKKIINKVLQELSIPVQCFNLLQEAVKFSISNAKAGEAVVLSPACASWDMFSNYKERAQVFIDSIYENIK